MTGLSLGIDLGTSGIRTAVLDANGDLISSVRADHLQQDPDNIDAAKWWTATKTCIALQNQALQDQGVDPHDIARIGVDGTSGTMVLTDAALRPVTPALMYNSSGFATEAAEVDKHAPAVHITKGTNSALARALRLQAHDTDKAAAHLLHQADFIIAHLRGVGGISDENNALKLGFDPQTGNWPSWFAQTNLRLPILPKVVPAGTALGPINPDVADQLGLSAQAAIHAGTTDSIAAFLAAAPLEAGHAVTSLGTTLAIKILSSVRIDAPEMGLYSHKVGDVWLVGGASNTGGGVLKQFFDTAALARLSKDIDPKVESKLDYYPLSKAGERFPINDPLLEPRLTPRPENDAQFLHGILESIARIERDGYRAIAAQGGVMPTQLFTAGGGAANDVWTAIRARVLGIDPQKAQVQEACVGIAKLIRQSG